MPRISGVDLPNNKPVKVALTYIYGIGRITSERILKDLNIDPNLRADKLSSAQVQSITGRIDQIPTEGDLKKIVRDNIQRLKRIGSYRGSRHSAGLPTRGQRTKTNGRTPRGKRQTVGAMTKEQRQKIEDASKK